MERSLSWIKSGDIVALWGDYVNWEGRRKGENGFLETTLRKYHCQKILDVALGDGADAIYLLQKGFEVYSNEVDDGFRQKAIENAVELGVSLAPPQTLTGESYQLYIRQNLLMR